MYRAVDQFFRPWQTFPLRSGHHPTILRRHDEQLNAAHDSEGHLLEGFHGIQRLYPQLHVFYPAYKPPVGCIFYKKRKISALIPCYLTLYHNFTIFATRYVSKLLSFAN